MSRYRMAVAIAGAFVLIPMVSGCASGTHPQTLLPTQFVEGVNQSLGQIKVRNAFLLGPAPGQTLPAGSDVPFYASIVNGDVTGDQLVAIETGLAPTVTIPGNTLSLPPHQLVQTGSDTNGVTTSTVIVKGVAKDLNGTETVAMTLHFARAGALTIQVPVVPWQGYYTTYAPAPTATPTPTAPSGTPTRKAGKAKHTPPATGSPTPTA